MRTHNLPMTQTSTHPFARLFRSLLGGLLFACLLPSLAFASSTSGGFRFGQSQGLDLASVSVVRLVVTYSRAIAAPNCAPVTTTGLGVIAGSWKTGGSSTFTDWVLTDDTLVNPAGVSTCQGKTAPLSTIQIYVNSAYTNTASGALLATLQCQPAPSQSQPPQGQTSTCGQQQGNISLGATQQIICQTPASSPCTAGTVLIPFSSSQPQPFIDPNVLQNTNASPFGIELASAANSLGLPTPSPSQATSFLVPKQVQLSSTASMNSEKGMPIVNGNGQLVDMRTNAADSGGNILAFVKSTLTPLQSGHTNPLHDAWERGINDYYSGHHNKVRADFASITGLNPEFQAAAAFAGQLVPPTSSKGGHPTTGTANTLGTSPSLQLVVALILLVLLLLAAGLLFLRRQIRRRREAAREAAEEMRRANAKAEVEAQRIAAQEQAQRQQARAARKQAQATPVQKQAANMVPAGQNLASSPPSPLRCPNCGYPVGQGDNFCSQCRSPLVLSDSGLNVRLAMPPAPAQAQPPLAAPAGAAPPSSLSISDMPTREMPPSQRQNGQPLADAASEKTVPYRVEQVMGRNVKFIVGTLSDPGIKRKDKPNEDSLYAAIGGHSQNVQLQQFGLFVVADGMGGHANGQDASRLAIQTIEERLQPRLLSNEPFRNGDYVQLLVDAVQSANVAVHQRNMEQRGDMGTTMTAALIVGTTAYIANVGDSRTYLYREPEGLQKITNDHSVVASLVEAGIITADDIYTHPKRNQIYRSLGEKPSVEVDHFTVQLKPGDKLLLCSDGLWDMTRDPIIQDILKKTPDPVQARHELIKAALDGGGEDNISVIVVQVTEDTLQTGINGFQVLARPEAPQYPSM